MIIVMKFGQAIDSVLFSLALIVGGMAFSSTLEAKKFEEITYEQTLEIKKGSASEYTSASGEEFSVGQEIILRSPANGHQTYTYVYLRVFAMPPLPVSSAWNGTRLKIDKISWKQVQGVPHVFLNTSAQGANFGGRKQMIGNLEAAFETREVVTSADEMRPVSEETPMEKLKKAKELLDLEVISQDEYDEIKKSLIPLIL
jgi:hypothetical protein